MRLLIDAGGDVQAADENGVSPLRWSVGMAQWHAAQMLLDAGAEHDIFTAAGMGDVEVVKELVARDPGVVHAQDEFGGTALHWAAERGTPEMVELLLEKGADIEARDTYGQPPLHSAAVVGKLEVVETLLRQGANVHAVDNDGDGVLVRTTTHRREDVARLLRRYGAKE